MASVFFCNNLMSMLNRGMQEPESKVVLKKKRRRKQYLRLNRKKYNVSLFPRIVKRDIRRLYPQILLNLLNTGNIANMQEFFFTFSNSACSFHENYLHGDVRESSLQQMATILMVEQDLMPDYAFTLRGARIKQYLRRSDYSEVICDVIFSGTKIYHYEPDSCAAVSAPTRVSELTTENEDDSHTTTDRSPSSSSTSSTSNSEKSTASVEDGARSVDMFLNRFAVSASATAVHHQSNHQSLVINETCVDRPRLFPSLRKGLVTAPFRVVMPAQLVLTVNGENRVTGVHFLDGINNVSLG